MLISIALDFRRATLKTRERFHLSDEAVDRLITTPRSDLVRELALVSTCNRLELYAWSGAQDSESEERAYQELADRWTGYDDSRARELDTLALRRVGEDAARHLMRVASGLESMVLGDVQIIGQVRRSYRQAIATGAVGTGLHRLFSVALRAAKRVQHETGLIGGRHSVGTEAAALAARRHGPLMKRRCVVVGCGKTGERAARHLVKLGAVDLVLINRTPERAEQLARELWGRAASWDRLHRELARADVAIIATSADKPPVRSASLRFCREMAGTREHQLLVLDLSVPRNVEQEVAGLPGVTLVDLDELHPRLEQAESLRQAAVPQAEVIVEHELADLMAWIRAEAAREALRPLREALNEVCRRELAWAGAKAGADLDHTAERIVAKLMARPMTILRNATERGESVDSVTATLRELFGFQTGSLQETVPLPMEVE
jgi:glutamyl-tRNA reductase